MGCRGNRKHAGTKRKLQLPMNLELDAIKKKKKKKNTESKENLLEIKNTL